MQIIFFGINLDILDELRKKTELKNTFICDDISTVDTKTLQDFSTILIADYDSVATEINKMISSNSLPLNTIVLERTPEIVTGKMLISHRVKAYGNSRVSNVNFSQMIQAVENGNVWTYPELTASLINNANKAEVSSDAKTLIDKRLTDKETEVVYLVLSGLTNDAIASKLNITPRTVKAHVSSIFSKLHVNDRVSLILLLK